MRQEIEASECACKARKVKTEDIGSAPLDVFGTHAWIALLLKPVELEPHREAAFPPASKWPATVQSALRSHRHAWVAARTSGPCEKEKCIEPGSLAIRELGLASPALGVSGVL